MGDLIEFTTWPGQRNVFYKISSNCLSFEVKAGDTGAAIVIGCNQLTWIKTEETKGKVLRTGNILNNQDYVRFWLLWANGTIQLGRGHETIISHRNELELSYVTFSTGKIHYDYGVRHAVQWRLELPPVLDRPIPKSITGGELQWVQADSQLPDGAFIGGYEKETLYIIKAPHQGSITPGKFAPSQGLGYISWGGQAHEKSDFEILCGFDCSWVRSSDDKIPVNAVEGGYSEDRREKLYVGRASLNGCLIPGKVQPSHRVCYVPYEGREVASKKFEILVYGSVKPRCANKFFLDHIEVESAPESDSDSDDTHNDDMYGNVFEDMGVDDDNEDNDRADEAVYAF